MSQTAIIPAPRHDLATPAAPDPATRWEAAARDWLKKGRSDRTKATYAAVWTAFLSYVQRPPWAIERADVIAWRDDLVSQGKADATVAARLAAISSFYRFARDEGLTDRNPCQGVERPSVEAYGKAVSITPSQYTALLGQVDRSTVQGRRDYAMLILEYGTAIRRAELVSIRRGDLVETPAGDIMLAYRPKGGDEETRTLPRKAVTALREYLADRGPLEASDPVFVAHDRGAHKRQARPLTAEAWRNIVTKYSQAALGVRIRPHALRHSAATEAWEQTRDLKQVQKLLGHKHVVTTQRYVDHLEDKRAQLGDRLLAALGL